MTNCFFCGGKLENKFNIYDDRYGYKKYFNFNRCEMCNAITSELLGLEIKDELSKLYANYYGREKHTPNLGKDKNDKKSALSNYFSGVKSSPHRWVPRGNKILDIGCGTCDSLIYLRSINCDVYGFDIDKNIEKIARTLGLPVHIGDLKSGPFELESFNSITMEQVLEHFTNPVTEIKEIAKFLQPDGQLILSTPNSNSFLSKLFKDKWIHLHPPYHVALYSKSTIKLLASKCNLEVVRIKTITENKWLEYQFRHIRNYPNFGEVSNFWTHSNQEKKLSFSMRLIVKFKIYIVILRILDFLGLGENLIIFLKKK